MSAASYYRLKQLKFSCAFLEVLKQRIILHCERTHIMKSENNRQNNYASNPFSFRTKKQIQVFSENYPKYFNKSSQGNDFKTIGQYGIIQDDPILTTLASKAFKKPIVALDPGTIIEYQESKQIFKPYKPILLEKFTF